MAIAVEYTLDNWSREETGRPLPEAVVKTLTQHFPGTEEAYRQVYSFKLFIYFRFFLVQEIFSLLAFNHRGPKKLRITFVLKTTLKKSL